jgi:HAD superfamily hydrolase (TIGR01459 family)
MMREISGLGVIARDFDAMLIDQFGVIHDGQKLYAGAADVLAELHALGIPVIVMTNSGKRSAPNLQRLKDLGVVRDHFLDCVSSGEVAFQSLNVGKAWLVGREGVDYAFDPVEFVADPDEAEVMLILGSNAPRTSLDAYRMKFAGLTLPAICCNPDKWMITRFGLQPAPGAIADVYASMGGRVSWIGKPHAAIYEYALKRLGNAGRVLCIGDSAEHDVAGGQAAGLSTLLVQQGVSAGVAADALHPQPEFLCAQFRW